MAKRRIDDSDDRSFGSGDSPIGLTSAFAPVKGPQSVDYAADDDPVGLTQAFGAIPDDDEPRAWDEEGKWKDFDWDAGYENQATGSVGAEGVSSEQPTPAADDSKDGATAAATSGSAKSSRGRHAAPEVELSPRMQKSRRTRKVLIILIVLLLVLVGVLAFFGYKFFTESNQDAAHQAEEPTSTTIHQSTIGSSAGDDGVETVTTKTDVPDLVSLFGMTSDEAVKAIGHGALVTANRAVNDGSAIKTNLNVALTEEPADSKTGTPTVYLGLDKDGKVIQVGYSASASALGLGTLSFAEAVGTEHAIEKTLAKIGIVVPEGTAVLPADKSTYTTYGSDKTSVVKERCSFEGPIEVNGIPCTWSAVLSYDYTTQLVTGNLNDTVRVVYVYVTENIEPEQPAEGGDQPQE